MSCSRTQRSDASENQTGGPLVLSQALYHCATALPGLPIVDFEGSQVYNFLNYHVFLLLKDVLVVANSCISSGSSKFAKVHA